MRAIIILSILSLGYGLPKIDSTTGQPRLTEDPRVIIVGGGVSGIAAATKLIENGFTNVKILEAENRLGGRVQAFQFEDRCMDLGAHWVHGEKGNIVYEIASKLDLLYHSGDYENQQFVYDDGEEMSAEDAEKVSDATKEILFNKKVIQKEPGNVHDYLLRKGNQDLKDLIKNEGSRNAFLLWVSDAQCTQEGCNNLTDVSNAGYDDYVDPEGDDFVVWKNGGFYSIIKILLKSHPKQIEKGEKSIDISRNLVLNCEVNEIDWSGEEAIVKCADGSFHTADHVIVTTSVGVLKERHTSMFKPSLPQAKINAIKGIGFGAVAKIYLYFEEEWWPANCTGFNLIRKNREPPTDGYNWEKGISGFYKESTSPNVLGGWMVGEDAKNMEKATDEQVMEGAYRVLKSFLGKKYNIPKPKASKRSQWYSNPHFRGTWSYRSMDTEALNTGAKDLAKALTNSHNKEILMFAGEATNEVHYGTVHGALESGWREADYLIKKYSKN